jgi:glycosyltransferase involved in cell wall biosynthesis
VGHEIFLKGGREIVDVVTELVGEGHPLRLTLVSNLTVGGPSRATEADRDALLADIRANSGFIRHHTRLPNPEVLDLLRRSHLALLPSWADTYGYSVLEAQACGCPAVTSDVKALPEFNDDECGYVVRIADPARGRAPIGTAEGRERVSRAIREQLRAILEDALANPRALEEKGERSLARIRRERDPGDRARLLREIYREAVGR